jgi:hypothetical protein
MENFWNGFVKAAEEDPEGHHVRRFFLSNPISAAIEARKGKKLQAFGEAWGHGLVEGLKGMGIGGAAGAGLGALGALATKKAPGQGALMGGLTGSQLGSIYGGIKGTHGAEASKIHGRYSKHRAEE